MGASGRSDEGVQRTRASNLNADERYNTKMHESGSVPVCGKALSAHRQHFIFTHFAIAAV